MDRVQLISHFHYSAYNFVPNIYIYILNSFCKRWIGLSVTACTGTGTYIVMGAGLHCSACKVSGVSLLILILPECKAVASQEKQQEADLQIKHRLRDMLLHKGHPTGKGWALCWLVLAVVDNTAPHYLMLVSTAHLFENSIRNNIELFSNLPTHPTPHIRCFFSKIFVSKKYSTMSTMCAHSRDLLDISWQKSLKITFPLCIHKTFTAHIFSSQK